MGGLGIWNLRGRLKFDFGFFIGVVCSLLCVILWYDGLFSGGEATGDTTNGYFRQFLAPSSFRFVPWLLLTRGGG